MKISSLSLLTSLLFLPVRVAGAAETKEFHQVFPLDAAGEFTLRTFKGEVKLVAWSRSEVKVDARIEADSPCGDDDRAERIKNTEIRVQSSARSVEVSTDCGHREKQVDGCSSLPFVNYEISVPATAKVRISDHKSNIHIANLRGDLRVTTHKGKLDISGLEGALDLQTHRGEGRASFAKWSQASRFETHKGDLEIVVPKGSGLNLDASLGRKGTLDSDWIRAADGAGGKDRSKRVQTAVNGGGPELRLVTHKGTFRLIQG